MHGILPILPQKESLRGLFRYVRTPAVCAWNSSGSAADGVSWRINHVEKAPDALCSRTPAVCAWNSAGFATNQVSQRVSLVERLPWSLRTPFTAELQQLVHGILWILP